MKKEILSRSARVLFKMIHEGGFLALLLLAACGKGSDGVKATGSDSVKTAVSYSLKIYVNNLLPGNAVGLEDNAGALVYNVTQNGGPFDATSTSASGFQVVNPASPSQLCWVNSVSDVYSLNVVKLDIACTNSAPGGDGLPGAGSSTPPQAPCTNPAGCFIAGAVAGLFPGMTMSVTVTPAGAAGQGKQITLSGGQAAAAGGTVTFTTPFAVGSAYSVSLVQPAPVSGVAVSCKVISTANADGIVISCFPTTGIPGVN